MHPAAIAAIVIVVLVLVGVLIWVLTMWLMPTASCSIVATPFQGGSYSLTWTNVEGTPMSSYQVINTRTNQLVDRATITGSGAIIPADVLEQNTQYKVMLSIFTPTQTVCSAETTFTTPTINTTS